MLLSLLEELTDFRSYHGKEYKLHHILYFSVLAILSNAKSYTEIATFIRVNFPFLKEHFGLKWRHAPDSSAIRKIIVAVDAGELEAIFQEGCAQAGGSFRGLPSSKYALMEDSVCGISHTKTSVQSEFFLLLQPIVIWFWLTCLLKQQKIMKFLLFRSSC